jgi:hypothetical protein
LGGNDNNLTYYNKENFEAIEKLTAPAYFVKYDPQRTLTDDNIFVIEMDEMVC